MQFNSIEFLFCFLPLFMAVYYLCPRSWGNPILLAGSLVFYGFSCQGNYWQLALLVGLTVVTYLVGRIQETPNKGWVLGIYLILMLGMLAFFKLYDSGKQLPVGMSFYLFQMAAYSIDVYRRKFSPEKNIMAFGAQTVMYPKLLSGPMMDPEQLCLQTKHRKAKAEDVYHGLQQLILGLGLKVLLADRIGGLWAQAGVMGYQNISTPYAWLALIAWTMRLFFDFYGYSLMAMGLGSMLGYELPRNFIDPYISKTVSEFYRRWHATLGAWFKNYLYIPLGGSRKGTIRTVLNLCVVWLFTGLWHGIGGNYLLWAGFLCLLIINERLWLGKLLKKTHVTGHVYTVFVILLSWVPFAIGDWGQMVQFLGRLFGVAGKAVNGMDYLVFGKDYLGYLIGGVLLATPFPRKLWEKIRCTFVADLLIFCLFWVVVYFISTAAQDPFLYFQY